LLIPAGVGVAVPSMTATVLSSAPRNRSALAAGVLNTVRQAAGAVGVAAFGALAATDMLAGMRIAFGLSAALLVVAGVLAAWSVRPAETR
jgi:DHA2 family methylenomycin A resistance protein-like MFS transporter